MHRSLVNCVLSGQLGQPGAQRLAGRAPHAGFEGDVEVDAPPWLSLKHIVRGTLLIAALAAVATAQTTIHGGWIGDAFGTGLATSGDVNADGVPDFVVVAPGADFNGIDSGSAFVYSGANLDPLFRIDGSAPASYPLRAAAMAGDTNADGRGDVVVLNVVPGVGVRLQIYSGLDGSVLVDAPLPPGASSPEAVVATAGDVTGDGLADVVVGNPSYYDASSGSLTGKVSVVSGADGSALFEVTGPGYGAQAGRSVAGVGDIDEDGYADIAATAPGYGGGALYVYAGGGPNRGSVLTAVFPGAWGAGFGRSLANAGDIDHDGHDDLVVGADAGLGYAQVYSAVSGELLRQFVGYHDGSGFGSSVAGGDDVDGDGTADIVVGAPFEYSPSGEVEAGAAWIYSGADSSIIQVAFGHGPKDRFGTSVGLLDDLNGDDRAEVIIGAPETSTYPDQGPGYVEILHAPTQWLDLSNGLAGTSGVPTLNGSGALLPYTPWKLSLSQAAPLASTVFVVGLSTIYAPLKGGVLVPEAQILVTGPMTNASGKVSLGGVWPSGVPSALTLYFQCWIVDAAGPAGFAASNAVSGTTP